VPEIQDERGFAVCGMLCFEACSRPQRASLFCF